ncbi:nuclear transport factor 2 family protein [Streptomyces sp. NPDC021622]|uniref:nuclear transport factor 2 family protein n=1 Tax=Streptomyces sp. NPDC021622 TaxID=3155013 RepID=UPI0033F496D5
MNTQPTASETDPVAVLTAMYEAESRYLGAGGPGEASFEPLAPYFAHDVVLHQADALPYGGTWRGHEGMVRFFLAMAEAWESFEIGEQEFFAAGDTVFVRSEVHARARATGRELDFPVLQSITVRDGRIAEVWPFYWDTAAIAAATGA